MRLLDTFVLVFGTKDLQRALHFVYDVEVSAQHDKPHSTIASGET